MDSMEKDRAYFNKRKKSVDYESEIPFSAILEVRQSQCGSALICKKSVDDTSDGNVEVKEEYCTVIDKKQLCHLCLCYGKKVLSLFNNEECEGLADMLSSITSLNVTRDIEIPSQICDTCKSDIRACYEFKMKCGKSIHMLRTTFEVPLMQPDMGDDTSPAEKNNQDIQTEVTEQNHLSTSKAEDQKYDSANKEEKDNLFDELVEYIEDDWLKSNPITKPDNNARTNRKQSVKPGKRLKVTKRIIKKCDENQLSTKKGKFMSPQKVKEHKLDSEIHCDKCSGVFSCQHDLALHAALHSGEWKCRQCHKEFDDRSRLRRHIARHFERKRHACDWCGKQFVEMCALRRHVTVHTGDQNAKEHLCPYCNKRFSHRCEVVSHMTRHTGERACVCDVCGKSFHNQRLLKSHRLVHSDELPYTCNFCDKRFRHISARTIHHRTHTGEKPYVCSFCGKTFIQNSNLTLHLRTHTGEKPYTCDICGRRFTSCSTLSAHAHTHTHHNTCECPTCGKKLNRSSLHSHMRQHSDVKPYECCICKKKFINASRLRAHSYLHTGEKPYECANCAMKFKKKCYLVRHLKTHERSKRTEKRDRQTIANDYMKIDEQNQTNGTSKYEGSGVTVQIAEEIPLDVSQELILNGDGSVKTDLIVINDGLNDENSVYVNNIKDYINSQIIDGVNLVAMGEGVELLGGASINVYQLDQNVVRIKSRKEMKINKVTSKSSDL